MGIWGDILAAVGVVGGFVVGCAGGGVPILCGACLAAKGLPAAAVYGTVGKGVGTGVDVTREFIEGEKFYVGQSVECRDEAHPRVAWLPGEVTSVEPLKVRTRWSTGYGGTYRWKYVRTRPW